MRIERDQGGDYVLEPTALAEKLSIPPEDLRRRMRLGLVTSLVEAGEGEHAGLRRLTVRCGDEVWRAVIDAAGRIIEEEWRWRTRTEPARASGHYGPSKAPARASVPVIASVPARPHQRGPVRDHGAH